MMARPSFRSEILTVLFFSVTLAAVDNSFVSVFVKQTFSGVAPDRLLNFVVALCGSASEIANILSFIWASASLGRPKVPFINALQLGVIILVASTALVPKTTAGLLVLAALVLAARVCWSGIILLRPGVWRANYRKDRARVVGRFSTVQQLVVAGVGIGLGAALDAFPDVFRYAAPAAAALGVVAYFATRRLRVRGEPAVLRAERDPASHAKIGKPWQGPLIVARVLRRDRRFAQFMICMFLLGFGNIMLTPMLVISLRDQFGFGYLLSILVTAGIPYLLMPIAIPVWARFLDRAHVVRFRAIHSWAFVLAQLLFLLAIATNQPALLIAGSVMLAVGFGGGTLAWNLGHVDFSPPAETSQYMATHVTLNGVRGLIAPLFAVALFEKLRAWDLSVQQAASWVLALGLLIAVAGSIGFVLLKRSMGSTAGMTHRSQNR
jgi:Major Facilitator Superfamily